MSDFKLYNDIQKTFPTASAPKAAGAGGFGNVLSDAIQQVTDLEKGSQGELQKFLGNDAELHSVMIALEKADLSFQVMMQVRNKIVQAYQEMMKTQV